MAPLDEIGVDEKARRAPLLFRLGEAKELLIMIGLDEDDDIDADDASDRAGYARRLIAARARAVTEGDRRE